MGEKAWFSQTDFPSDSLKYRMAGALAVNQTFICDSYLTLFHFGLSPVLGIKHPANNLKHKHSTVWLLSASSQLYLTELLKVYKPTRQLHFSSDTSIVYLPFVLTLTLSEIFFLCCTVCLKQSPLQS